MIVLILNGAPDGGIPPLNGSQLIVVTVSVRSALVSLHGYASKIRSNLEW